MLKDINIAPGSLAAAIKLISIEGKVMPSLLLRYEDETEIMLERLQSLLSIKTKNKTVIEVIDNYENLTKVNESLRADIENLEDELRNIKSVLAEYKVSRNMLENLLSDIKT